jgi:hypothetical protein
MGLEIPLTSFFFRVSLIPSKEFENYRERTQQPNSKVALFDYLMRTAHLNRINKGKISYNILKEYWFINNMVFYTKKNFFMLEKFNEIISQIKSSGLMNHWVTTEIEGERKNSKAGPKQLKLEHLEGVFEVWLIGLCVAVFGFVMEKVSFVVKRRVMKNNK